MDDFIYKTISANLEANQKQYSATVIKTTGSSPASIGQKMIIYPNGEIVGTIGGGALEKMVIADVTADKINAPQTRDYSFNDTMEHENSISTGMICGGSAEIFIEPLFAINELFIFGAGHCSLELVSVMQGLGFFVTVLDERAEWLNKHTQADRLIECDFGKVEQFVFSPNNSYIVIMTYGHINDEKVLEQFLSKKYKYLGLMGSKNKVATLKKRLLQTGKNSEIVQNIHAPIGININSRTPKEIAISIAAELINEKNRT